MSTLELVRAPPQCTVLTAQTCAYDHSGNPYAADLRVRVYNVGCATPSEWSDVLSLASMQEEDASLPELILTSMKTGAVYK